MSVCVCVGMYVSVMDVFVCLRIDEHVRVMDAYVCVRVDEHVRVMDAYVCTHACKAGQGTARERERERAMGLRSRYIYLEMFCIADDLHLPYPELLNTLLGTILLDSKQCNNTDLNRQRLHYLLQIRPLPNDRLLEIFITGTI